MISAFRRLRWSVFEAVSNVHVVEDLDSPQPELFPFLDHQIAGEPATKIPPREIADGGAITIGDILKQLLGYIIDNKDDILEATAPFLSVWTQNAGDGTNVTNIPALRHYDISDNTRAFFNGFTSEITVDDAGINVDL
ncbi:uncharacterized protein EKO05_0005592 [Ascochyta rabiei]|uniref:uncharacterized protein n=1 Tax=Didymella rabiei TaxID=5454 RepID=UPI0018FFD3CB|nr:uncharacterized protein EKO05_0005592 [Ascochyta rabiei]UPX15133.1 hypothetical protein EKO05_0005592 [Ascochyta rabiei]